jgi:hypothetical protein
VAFGVPDTQMLSRRRAWRRHRGEDPIPNLASVKGGRGKKDEITPNEMLGQKVGTEFYAID